MTKEELAEQYKIETDGDAWCIDAFIAGWEACEIQKGENVWISVEDNLPEEDVEVLCCLINKWSKELSKHSVLRYFQGNWYGDITEDETVEKWTQIPR